MIGHTLNGYTIVAAAPSTVGMEYFTILAVANDKRIEPFVVAYVHARQAPTPTEWWTGHYSRGLDTAVETFLKRIPTNSPEAFAAGIARVAETLLTEGKVSA